MADWTGSVTPDMLKRKVTLEEYFSPLFQRLGQAHLIQAAIDLKKVPLLAMAEPGDEWWEWVAGDEPLMQFGGLALVRHGGIVWARQDWIS